MKIGNKDISEHSLVRMTDIIHSVTGMRPSYHQVVSIIAMADSEGIIKGNTISGYTKAQAIQQIKQDVDFYYDLPIVEDTILAVISSMLVRRILLPNPIGPYFEINMADHHVPSLENSLGAEKVKD